MNRVVLSQAVSADYEMNEQLLPGLTAWKSDSCVSDVQTDTDSYKTADDDDQPVLGDDPLNTELTTRVHDGSRLHDSSELESSSSPEEDDSYSNKKDTVDCPKQPVRRTKSEQRRKSYQFAVSKSGDLIQDSNDDGIFYDMDPVEFHHEHRQLNDRHDEDSGLPYDLDPREFSHPSTQKTVQNSTVVEGDKCRSDREQQPNSEVSECDLYEGRGKLHSVERCESVVEGKMLPTIIIHSPTEKTLATDRREWIVRQFTKRTVFNLSLILKHSPLYTAAGSDDKLTDEVSRPLICSPEDEEQLCVHKNYKPLPIMEAVIRETTELIRARLIESGVLWDPDIYDETNISFSPEKESEFSLETIVPSPDYDSSVASSDSSFEADDDVALIGNIHHDTPPHRTDRSPTPDYDVPSLDFNAEFQFDAERYTGPELAAEVQPYSADIGYDETKVNDDVYESSIRQSGSQRFSNSVHHDGAVTKQAYEDEALEPEQKYGDVCDDFEPIHSIEDSGRTQQQYRSGLESAPVMLPSTDKGMFLPNQTKTYVPHGDQPPGDIYATLGHFDKRRRTAKRRSKLKKRKNPPLNTEDHVTKIPPAESYSQIIKVVLRKSPSGFGMTMSGFDPVFIQALQDDGVALKAGVCVGDKIFKINGTLVTHFSHNDVVKLVVDAGLFLQLDLIREVPISELTRHSSLPLAVKDELNRSMSPDVHLLGSSPSTVGYSIDMAILSVDDNDDEIMHAQSTESMNRGVFGSMTELMKRPAHLSVFIHYILSSRHDAAPLLFTLVADGLSKHGGSVKELTRWAHEIFATFLAEYAPLRVTGIDSSMVESIERVLQGKTEQLENELRALFHSPLHCISSDVNELLRDYRNQRLIGLGNLFGEKTPRVDMEKHEELKVVETELWDQFLQYSRDYTDVSQAMAASLATFFKQIGLPDASGVLENYNSFNTKDRKASWLKTSRKSVTLGHHFMRNASSFILPRCGHCDNAVWNAFNSGFHCAYCQLSVHKWCIDKLLVPCLGGSVRVSQRRPLSSTIKMFGSLRPQLPVAAGKDKPVDDVAESDQRVSGVSTRSAVLDDSFVKVSVEGGSVSQPSGPQFSAEELEDLSVASELPSLDSVIPKHELHSLKKEEKKRQEVINELFHTERTHVRDLRVMQLLFYRPMIDDALVNREFINLLFPSLDTLIQAHSGLKDKFADRKKEGSVVERVGDILVNYFGGENSEQFLAACSAFCQDQSHAYDVLRIRRQKDPKLAEFLQEASCRPLCRRMELKDLLPKEMQRLTKYPLLIDSLLKHTSQKTEEYGELTEAKSLVKRLLERVNEAVRERENLRRTVDMKRRLDMRLLETTNDPELAEFKTLDLMRHKLLRDGKMMWRLGGGKQVEVHVALFTDIILLMLRQEGRHVLRSQNVIVVAGKENIVHGPVIKLDKLIVQPYAADRRTIFVVVTLKDAPKRYELVAPSTQEKNKWLDAMNAAVAAAKKQRLQTNVDSSRMTVSPAFDMTDAMSTLDHIHHVDTLSVMSVVEPDHVERLQLMNTDMSVNEADPGSDSVSPMTSSHNIEELRRTLSVVHTLLDKKLRVIEELNVEDDVDIASSQQQPVISNNDDDFINTALSQVSRLEQFVHCSPAEQSASLLTSPVGPASDCDRDSAADAVVVPAAELISISQQLHHQLISLMDMMSSIDERNAQLRAEWQAAWNQLNSHAAQPPSSVASTDDNSTEQQMFDSSYL